MSNDEDLNESNFDTDDFSLDVEEAKEAIQEEANKDLINLTEEESLNLKNFNLQIILADKNIENLQLKQSLLLHEKETVINQIKDFKIKMQKSKNIHIDDYVIDLPNKRMVHKSLLQKK